MTPAPTLAVTEFTRIRHVWRPPHLGGPRLVVRDRIPDDSAKAGWRPWQTFYPAVWLDPEAT